MRAFAACFFAISFVLLHRSEARAATVASAEHPADEPLARATWTPGLEIFAGYAFYRYANGSRWDHAFVLPRALASVSVEADAVNAKLSVEAVHSTEEGALIGVAGDSMVLRVREAWTGYAPTDWVALRAGVVPNPMIAWLDSAASSRVVSPSALERTHLSAAADLGGGVTFTFPRRYGEIVVQATNGEGYNQRELNRGKNIEVAAKLRPLVGTFASDIAVLANYTLGSTGPALVRSDRLTTALVYEHERVGGGCAFTYAWGVPPMGDQKAWVIDAFVHAEPWKDVLAAGRAALVRANTDANQRDFTWTAAAGYRLARPLEAWAVFEQSLPSDETIAIDPDSQHWEARIMTRITF